MIWPKGIAFSVLPLDRDQPGAPSRRLRRRAHAYGLVVVGRIRARWRTGYRAARRAPHYGSRQDQRHRPNRSALGNGHRVRTGPEVKTMRDECSGRQDQLGRSLLADSRHGRYAPMRRANDFGLAIRLSLKLFACTALTRHSPSDASGKQAQCYTPVGE
jgi:hypothetical protein